MNVLDLFSGIGGFSLGLEAAGMTTVAFCEIEEFPRRVLAKHWPNVPIYDDVRTLTAERLAADGIAVDVICGGFPCQDISFAGAGAGLGGSRSGLWSEYARLVSELRPSFVIVENVAALLSRGLGDVLGTLAALGYDAIWHCIPASYVGAPHRRDRIWIIAYRQIRDVSPIRRRGGASKEGACNGAASDADSQRQQQQGWRLGEVRRRRFHSRSGHDGWATHWADRLSALCGVDDGVSRRLDEAKPLGNAVVPQIPRAIGEAIMRLREAGFLFAQEGQR